MADRLYRSRTDRMLFGVAGGMARYLNLDSAIVRLVWVILFLAAGAGILLYIIAAIVIPEEPVGSVPPGAPAAAPAGSPGAASGPTQSAGPGWPGGGARRDGSSGAIVLGAILILAGAWFLADRFLDIDGRLLWPIVLVVLGAVLILGAMRGTGSRRP